MGMPKIEEKPNKRPQDNNDLKLPWENDHMTDWIYGNDEEPLLTIQFEDEDISSERAIKIQNAVVEAMNKSRAVPSVPDTRDVDGLPLTPQQKRIDELMKMLAKREAQERENDAEIERLRGLISRSRLEIWHLYGQAGGDVLRLKNATVNTKTGGVVPQLYAELRAVPKPNPNTPKETLPCQS